MEIKTKYNIGDLVYSLTNKGIEYLSIGLIRIDINENGKPIINYRLDNNFKGKWREEDKVFLTKEELIKSL